VTDGFEVRYTAAARDDLLRLFDFLLARAETVEHFDAAQSVIDTLTAHVEAHLSHAPFIYRKAGQSPFVRELVVPCRGLGYVDLYEIEGHATVNILAVRHQREDDYH
jgi:plasmid stabilization system protein ParE